MNFEFPKIKHIYPLTDPEIRAFEIRPRPLPSDWANENINLVTGGYDIPGKLTLKQYQIEPVNAIVKYRRLIFCGSTRTFKSGITDIIAFYGMRFLGVNGCIAYSETETARLIFKTRIRPMIEHNKELRELWDGNQDNLTMENILLKGSFWRIASAQNKNDLATTGAGFVIGSEVAKWEKMDFNPVDMMYGRQDAYPLELRKSVIESSPYEVGDYLYQEMFKHGNLILVPQVPCPICGKYQELIDSQIKLRGVDNQNEVDKSDHNAARIRNDKETACYYECIYCKQEIRERDRFDIEKKIKYVAPEIMIPGDDKILQQAERILDDGTIVNEAARERRDTVVFKWNRLVDSTFTFYECLARFFEGVHHPEKKKVYDNETMSRFTYKKTGRVEIGNFDKKKRNYSHTGNLAIVPDGVLIITAGIDAMDKDFHWVIQGWGAGMASWILQYGVIYCPIAQDTITSKENMLQKFKEDFFKIPLVNSSGKSHAVRLAFIDRGGHRPSDVDYIVSKIPFIQAYIGSNRPDPKKDLIYKSENGNYFMGQSETFSEHVGMLMDTDMWYLPMDVSSDFISQATAQYHVSKKTPEGNTRTIWVKEPQDHYRSCLNMSYAAAKMLNLDTALFREDIITGLQKQINKTVVSNEQPEENQNNEQRRVPTHGYFDRAIGNR